MAQIIERFPNKWKLIPAFDNNIIEISMLNIRQKLPSDFLLNKIGALTRDLKGKIKLLAKLILVYVFKISCFTSLKL